MLLEGGRRRVRSSRIQPEERAMPAVSFVVPVLSGKEEADLAWMEE